MQTDLQKLATLVLDALPQAALVVSRSGRVALCNVEARTILPAGQDIRDVLVAADGSEVRWVDELAALAEGDGGLVRRNVRLAGKGDRQLMVDVYFRPLGRGQEGEQWAGQVLVLVEDVSPRISAERRLATGERLAAAGTLAAQVAHELNNPLDGVLRFIGLAERVAGDEAAEYLKQARGGLMRMAQIIRGLLEQGRPWQRAGERAAVQQLLDEAVRTMQPRAQTIGVTMVCDFDDRVDGTVEGSVFQVFCNVIKNALDAMPDGGLLTIAVRPDEGGGCEIEFSDNGHGLSEAEAERIFQPFYTTKAPDRGSGLGLAICREIVGRLGGTIAAGPRAEGGATVAVRLPLHAGWNANPQGLEP